MNDLQKLEKTIGDLILIIEKLQRDMIELKESNNYLSGNIRVLSDKINEL